MTDPSVPTKVVAAAILRGGTVLGARMGAGSRLAGLLEFPGRKVERDEEPRAALAREIREELGCSVDVAEEVVSTTYKYDFGTIDLTTYFATMQAGEPRAHEHAELLWLPATTLRSLRWAPADIPAVERVIQLLGTAAQKSP